MSTVIKNAGHYRQHSSITFQAAPLLSIDEQKWRRVFYCTIVKTCFVILDVFLCLYESSVELHIVFMYGDIINEDHSNSWDTVHYENIHS